MANTREKEIEKYLREQVEARGGMCLKFVSPMRNHVPDRLIILPHHSLELVETKHPKKDLTPGQVRFRNDMEVIGHRVDRLRTKGEVDNWLAFYQ